MKRIVVLLLLLVSLLPALCAYSPIGSAEPFKMIGIVGSNASFEVIFNDEVLPFDLESSDVAYNASSSTLISGLKIGEYTLVTNTTNFKLTVTHELLKNNEDSSAIVDYRLYMVTDSGFKSSLSQGSVVISGSDYSYSQLPLSLAMKAIYVSLEPDTSSLATSNPGKSASELSSMFIHDLAEGSYSSTVTFVFESGN